MKTMSYSVGLQVNALSGFIYTYRQHLFSIPIKNEIKSSLMMMFTCGIKKIKGAAHKNGDVDGMCKRPLIYSIGINVCAV